MNTKEYSFRSASNLCDIKAWQWYPDEDVKAVIQIHHGMAEHSGRYKGTIKALVNLGYAVFMNDMINHGKSNEKEEDLGYFGENDGYKDIIKDAKTLYDMAKNEYPDKKIIILGHSMGSLIMRCFAADYKDDYDGMVLTGTSGPNPLAGISIGLTNKVSAKKGKKYRSDFLNKIGFGSYNKMFEKRTEFDWLSRIEASVDNYIRDPKCGYVFTSQGFNDLAKLVIKCNSTEWYKTVRSDAPIYILSGSMDPVGEYGKGVKKVYDKLKSTNHTNVKLKIYTDSRHEILNEINKKEVIYDIDEWITDVVLK